VNVKTLSYEICERVNLPVGPTRSVFVTNLLREETQNPQCFNKASKCYVVLLIVHLSIILVINQLNAQNLILQ